MSNGEIEMPIKVTKTVFTVVDFLNWQRDGQLNLRPYFQRGDVWTPKAKSFLIDTLLRGYPIPVIYIQNKTDSKSLHNVRQVVDGQQRLRTILAYIDIECLLDAGPSDRFTISRAHNRELANATFDQLPDELRHRLITTEISVHTLPTDLPDKLLLELFARLNSTGERLNDQELRNAEFHGAFKSTAYALANDNLEAWTTWSLFPMRGYPQMKHVELTSELIRYLLYGAESKSKSSLDNTYREFDEDFPAADDVTRAFNEAITLIARATEPDGSGVKLKKILTQSWMYSIFAYVVSSLLRAPLISGEWPETSDTLTVPRLKRALYRLETNLVAQTDLPDELEKALRGASTDLGSRLARLRFLGEQFGA